MDQKSEFESLTENELLKEEVRREIQRDGRITFCRFMDLALYHPLHGYYSSLRQKLGRGGDYLTSPEAHPLFGQLVAKQLEEMWRLLGAPSPFDVFEMGAGTGMLCRDILRWAQRNAPDFLQSLAYRLCDRSDEMRERQRRTLAELGAMAEQVTWEDGEPAKGSVEGCVLSNELVDSFPVHRVMVDGGELREVYVTWREGRFEEETGLLSTTELVDYFDALGLRPGEGCKAEENLAAIDWMRHAARILSCGFVLTFDYGYPAEELYAPWRRDGTLLCFYRHSVNGDPYSRLGYQDMTSHVDFTTLIRVGEEEGLRCVGLARQDRFLTALGIASALAEVPDPRCGGLEEYYARRRAVTELTDPAGLGRIRVLVQEKGTGVRTISGLSARE